VKRLDFTEAERRAIDDHAAEGGIDLWEVSSRINELPVAGGVPRG
jgi:L-glyceraldehyde 3-phosphate reductase